MEDLEQPQVNGSNNLGKFKDADSLLKAYNNLEAEFTKKSQKLATLESEKESAALQENKKTEIERKVDDLATKFEMIRPFSNTLKETLINDKEASPEIEALKLVAGSYKRAEDYAVDNEFLNNYIFSNQEIKDKIIKEYLGKVTQNSPIKIETGSANIPLTPPRKPATIEEAGRMARTIIKQK